MPNKRESILVACRYYKWLLSQRGNVWRADGRSNNVDAGRHSLGTHDVNEAKQLVHELDEAIAMKLGRIERRSPTIRSGLTIEKAVERFRTDRSRPVSVGGVEPATMKRYNRILSKFEEFACRKHIRYVTEINSEVFDEYVSMLEEMDFAHSTIVTEMTLLTSVHLFCIEKKLLDPRFGFKYPLKRNYESLTFCPSDEEVAEILRICRDNVTLAWLYRVVSILSMTGLRFGEARDLEWRDVDKDCKLLHVRDESYQRNTDRAQVRKTKTRQSRRIPIHSELANLLQGCRKESGIILTGPRGGTLRNDLFGDTLRDHVIPAVINVVGSQDVERLTAHGFRHYFVSRCANAGVPQLSVMSWLGHRTARMTNYYYHSNEAASLKHMRQLEAAESSGRCDQNR